MEKKEKTKKGCQCPYCDVPVVGQSPFCELCGAKLRFCGECGYVVPRAAQRCPKCGAKLGVEVVEEHSG